MDATKLKNCNFGAEDTILFNRIYHEYHKQMEYTAYQILQNRQDTEDAVQEAMISLIGHIGLLREMEDFRRYYYVIETAKNRAIDILRKRKYPIPYEELSECSEDTADFTDRIAERDAADEMLSYIRTLPEHYRDVLGLCYVNGLNSKQIAEVVGRSDTTVRKQLQRGRELLLKKWKEKHHDRP